MSFPTLYINNTGNFTASGEVIADKVIAQATATSVAGTTAGTIKWAQPEQGARKAFVASLVAYENDTVTAQVITYPVPFLYLPMVIVEMDNQGLVITTTVTALTIASGLTTVFNGVIDVVGV